MTDGGQTVAREVDLATMPIYVRAGAIIPVDPVRQYTSQVVTEPTTLQVYRGASGRYTLYGDDGSSQEYLGGRATWTRILWDDRAGQLTIEPGAAARSPAAGTPRVFRKLVLPDCTTRSVTYAGKRVRVRL